EDGRLINGEPSVNGRRLGRIHSFPPALTGNLEKAETGIRLSLVGTGPPFFCCTPAPRQQLADVGERYRPPRTVSGPQSTCDTLIILYARSNNSTSDGTAAWIATVFSSVTATPSPVVRSLPRKVTFPRKT